MPSKFGSHGLPLCLSGFTLSHVSVSAEMADHDRRREAMRRQRSSADPEIGLTGNMEERLFEAIRDGGIHGDLQAFLDDVCKTNLICAARAA